MSQMFRTATAALIAAAIATAAYAQKVSHDFDKTAEFAGLKTFAFKDGTPSSNPLVDDRITAAITSALSGRGMTNDAQTPDVYVVTHLTFEKQKDITAYSTGYGPYGWYWGGGWGATDVRVRDILMGTLVIDVVDAAKGAVIWRGIGVKEVKEHPKPADVDRNVSKAVTRILKNFPPGKS